MKKLLLTALLAMTIAASTATAFAGTAVNPDITFNGVKVDAEAYVKGGTTYVPVRVIADLFDTEINWNKQKQVVLIGDISAHWLGCVPDTAPDRTVKNDGKYYDNHSIRVYKDELEMKLEDANGKKVFAVMKNNANYLPVRAISNAFGCEVAWDNTTKTVQLTKEEFVELTVPCTDRGFSSKVIQNVDIVLDGVDANVKTTLIDGTPFVTMEEAAKLFHTEVEFNSEKWAVLIGPYTESYIDSIPNESHDWDFDKYSGKIDTVFDFTLHKDNREFGLPVGQDSHLIIWDGELYLPLNIIAKKFNTSLNLNDATKTVILTSGPEAFETTTADRPEGYAGGTYFPKGWTSSALSTYNKRARMLVAEYDKTEDHTHGIWRTYTDNNYSNYMNDYTTDEGFFKYEVAPGTAAHTWEYGTSTTEFMQRPTDWTNLGISEVRNTCGKALKLIMTGNGTCPDQEYIIPNGDTVILMPMKDGSGAKCLFYYADGTGLLAQYYWEVEGRW